MKLKELLRVISTGDHEHYLLRSWDLKIHEDRLGPISNGKLGPISNLLYFNITPW